MGLFFMHFKSLLEYNYWANKRLASCLGELPDEKLFADLISSFSGIPGTLMHLEGAEQIWLNRISGKEGRGFDNQVKDRERLLSFPLTSKEWVQFISNQDNDFFDLSSSYRSIKGEPFTSVHTEIITHVVNHSSFHRGQIITMLRQLEVETIPSTDYIVFCRL